VYVAPFLAHSGERCPPLRLFAPLPKTRSSSPFRQQLCGPPPSSACPFFFSLQMSSPGTPPFPFILRAHHLFPFRQKWWVDTFPFFWMPFFIPSPCSTTASIFSLRRKGDRTCAPFPLWLERDPLQVQPKKISLPPPSRAEGVMGLPSFFSTKAAFPPFEARKTELRMLGETRLILPPLSFPPPHRVGPLSGFLGDALLSRPLLPRLCRARGTPLFLPYRKRSAAGWPFSL